MEHMDIEKIINCIGLVDIYKIADAFDTIYYMGNVSDFYMNDIDGLKLLRDSLNNQENVDYKGVTRRCAIEFLIAKVDKILLGLGVGGENE
jgi:hypothetical protein